MEPKAPEQEPGVPPAWPPMPAPSGDGAVDAVLAELAGLTALPVTEQAAAYQQIHEALTGALEGEAPDRAPAAAGSAPAAGSDPVPPGPAEGARPGPFPGPRQGTA